MANWGSKCCCSGGAEGGGQGRASENRTILSVSKEVVLWLYVQRGQFIEKWKPARFKKKKKRGFHFWRKWKSKQEFWREVGEKLKKWIGIEEES